MSPQPTAAKLRQLGALAGIVTSLVPQVPVPSNWQRAIVTLGGVALFLLEHYVADPSTGRLVLPRQSAPQPADLQRWMEAIHGALGRLEGLLPRPVSASDAPAQASAPAAPTAPLAGPLTAAPDPPPPHG